MLEISSGKIVHPFERAKLLTGLLAISSKGAALLRSGEFSTTQKLDGALQAGPFLVDHGSTVAGLDATRIAYRTAVVVDDAHRPLEVDRVAGGEVYDGTHVRALGSSRPERRVVELRRVGRAWRVASVPPLVRFNVKVFPP